MKQLSSARELVVTASNRKAFIVAEDGTLQPLMIGQHIPAGAVVQIADDGELQTEPVAPVHVAQLHHDLPPTDSASIASADSDIDKLQNSILAGIDPTLELEATAAGGAAAAATGDASGSGNGGFIVIDRTSDSTLATAGFDTSDESTATTTAVLQPAAAVSAAVNAAPATSDIELTTNEDQPITGAIVATDLDGDSLSYTVGTNPANGSVTLNADGSFTYTPATDFNGSDSFTVTVSDGKGGSTTSTVTIGVGAVNDGPTSANLSLTTTEEQAVSGAIVATDLDGDSLSYTMADGPANGAVTLNSNGTFTYTPTGDFNGSDRFTVTISDGQRGSTTSTVTIGVMPLNDAPEIVDAAVTVAEDLTAGTALVNVNDRFTLNDTDRDGQAIRYEISAGNGAGLFVIDAATGVISLAPGQHLDYETAAQHQLTVTASDGSGSDALSDTATVTIHVGNVNDNAPTSSNDTITIQEDMGNTSNRYILKVDDFGSFSDQDAGDKLQMIRIDSLPANGTFYLNGVAITSAMVSAPGGVTIKVSDISAENLKFDPADNSDLDSSFKFSVSDGTNWSNTSYATQINITALADRPILNIASSEYQGGIAAANNKGNGLVLSYYDNVAGLDHGNPNSNSSNAKNTVKVESVLEATTPKTIAPVTDLGVVRTIDENDAYSAKGLIYLEAGHTYTFTGHQDDTFRLEIGGEVLVNNGFNTHKDYSGAYKVTTSGYYTFEMFAYNGHYIGDFSVKVAVDTGTAVNLSTSNIPLYTGIDAVDNAGLQHGAQTVNGDGGYYEVEYNHGMAETAIALSPISAVLTDLDLSESLALKIGSIPAGAVLSDGIHSFTATTALGSIDISTWNSSSLKLTPPDGFAGQIQLTITATATESSNADHASTTSNLLVTVDATAGETTALLSTYTLVDSDDMGLSGEYYGYNERGNAQTSTESSGTNNSIIRPKDGLVGNLDDLRDVYSVINAKQDVATSSTGSILIGQTNPGKASASATDAVFVATTFDYGGIKNGGVLANLGDGNPLLMTPGSAVTSGHLYTFLNDGGSRGDASSLVTTSGFGSSTDSIIRMLGSAYFEAGKYDFQISADDGFALYVDGKLVVQHDEKTAGSTETNESLNINLPYIELSEGLHNIEVVYWDQGGSASFDLSYKLDSVKTWTAFNSNNLALFQDGEAPTLGSLDDLVKGTDGHWYIQTGVDYSAGSGSDTITGTDGKDIIYGNSGNDTLAGGGNNDVLDGGLGNDILVGDSGDDVLTGGDGNDTFKWVKGDAASPAVDHVTDFDVAHDVLDISDLLEGYSAGTTDVLKQYLSVGSSSDGSTTIEVHNSTTSSSPVVQTIVLDGMSYSDLTGSGSSSASDVLNHLIDSHLLNIDK